MFWACFHGTTKGSSVFWEKEWGSISEKIYRARIVPILDGWIRMHTDQGLTFMQDSAPSHTARGTIQDLQEQGIICSQWPSYSPDLNSIEHVWNKMKDWIQDRWEDELRTYNELRAAIQAVWEAIEESYLEELLSTMQARCQAVIDANGMHTQW